MKIYHYHAVLKTFEGETEADQSPLEPGVFLIPANATSTAPHAVTGKHVNVFENNEWVIKQDNRGTYWSIGGEQHDITEVGVLPDPTWLITQPAVIPTVLTMRQARLALHAAGLLTQVAGAIDALAEPLKTQAAIEWEFSTEVQRNRPLVQTIAAALSLSETQLDDLFLAGSVL